MSDLSPTNRPSVLDRWFRDHPASVDETYFQHMAFAASFAGWMGLAAGAALVHAIVPAVCETTASRILARLNAKIADRH